MSVASRGIRNAFRNRTRTISIVLILGLAIGLALVMLIAHRSVNAKASTALSSVGNTVTIGPPGYSAGGRLGRFLTSAELAPIARLPGVTGINESLNGAAKASNLRPVARSRVSRATSAAASNNASPSPERSPTDRSSSSPTSQPETLTRRHPTPSSSYYARSPTPRTQPSLS